MKAHWTQHSHCHGRGFRPIPQVAQSGRNPPKTKKMPKDAEKVESERMGRVMLDNNNEKKLLLLIPEKKK